MRLDRIFALAALLAALAGCTPTWASGSAVSPDPNQIYVTGRHGNNGKLWLCPARKTGQQCQAVNVVYRR
jgi:hypothetical protein